MRNKKEVQTNTKVPEIQSSHVILLVSGNYVLQLRDNKPTIAAAGQWSLFGGMINDNETPLQAIKREVKEELLITPPEFRFLWFKDYYAIFEKTFIRTFFFVADVSTEWPNHRLMEGEAASIFSFNQIQNLDIPSIMRQTIENFHKGTKIVGQRANE